MENLTLGQRLKFFRKRENKSQKDIFHALDIPQSTLSGWERDKFEPTVSNAVKLAKYLKVSLPDLIGESEKGK